jgi:hypothetical protein
MTIGKTKATTSQEGKAKTIRSMNITANFEHRAGSSQSKHEGESSFALCDRLSRTRDNSQRQLPTDHDYAVPTREYQTDQSSLKPAQAAARSVLGERQRQIQKQPPPRGVDTVTPYQGDALIRSVWDKTLGARCLEHLLLSLAPQCSRVDRAFFVFNGEWREC